ncbi:DUF4412 domain-containing protein [Mariniphaga sp.]|uniref:DUF4412 domain-containing protein n=1 Tax=Mariniphaga sp. TaxID=1954475 RepID=UPI00356AA352
MKLLINLLLIAFVSAILTQPAHGQKLLRKLQEKVQERTEEKVEERVDKKIDEAIDKQLDKIEESLESDSENEPGSSEDRSQSDRDREQRMQNIMKGIGIGGEPVPVADAYAFKQMIEMRVESYNKNGKLESEGDFITHLSPDSKSMAYQVVSGDMGNPGQGMFIIDADNGATIILSEEKGEKTGIVYGMGAFFSSIGETYEEENLAETPEAYLANPNVKKTGRSKTIAGYKCEEYKFNDEETESEVWITQDLKMNTQDFFSTLFKTNLYARGVPWGYMMEATTLDKETGEKSVMQVTRVDANSNKRFNMADYQITNLGSFTMPAEEE